MASISAADRGWDSPNTLYIARRLAELSSGSGTKVLEIGCGDGRIMSRLLETDLDLYGYDLDRRDEALRARLAGYYGADFENHVRIAPDERTIPFEDDAFDLAYASQVFEHVKFLDPLLAECARVLKPEGALLANFPLATYPIEGHLKIPFAHWMPPGAARKQYLRLLYALRLRPRYPGLSPADMAARQERYLTDQTFYRFLNEVEHVARYHFGEVEIETGRFLQAKLDLMEESDGRWNRMVRAGVRVVGTEPVANLVTHLVNAAFLLRGPIKRNHP